MAFAIAISGTPICPRAAIAEPIKCPSTIRVDQRMADVPAGWTSGRYDLPIQLAGVTFFDGPPDQLASLVYDSYKTAKRETRAVWTFQRNSPRGFWISCNYDRSSITLSQRLSPSITRCEVIYDRGSTIGGFNVIKSIDCE